MRLLAGKSVTFNGEDGGSLQVSYDNTGEPYRQGISLWLHAGSRIAGVFLEEAEARKLRDLIDTLYPRKQ